jgi:hypothetical protein
MRHLFLSICVLILSTALPVVAAPPAVAPKSTAVPTKPKLPPAPDGPRIVERRGKFVIKPETLFCGAASMDPKLRAIIGVGFNGPSIDGVYLGRALEKIGQSGDARGIWTQKNDNCPHNGNNIMVTGRAGMNPLGKPYQLELEARQGAGAYVKVVFVKLGLPDDVQLFRVDPIGDDGRTAASSLNWQYRVSIGRSARSASKILVDELFK